MRYANISFLGKEICNIGDNLQLMAIDHLYMCMGIKADEIVRIPYNELSTWKSDNGEKVLLPVNFPFMEYSEQGLAGIFSADIIPVFLGLTYIKTYLSQSEVEYLKRHEPIGCRDEYTYNTMQRYGIQSWLNGCMTLTMYSKRIHNSEEQKVYLVNVPEEIEARLPKNIVANAEKRNQRIKREELCGDINDFTERRMREYKEKAKVVVTTLLHCTIPCISMGIPVIVISPERSISYRFSWVERMVPIYSSDDVENISWNIYKEADEEIRDEMLENAIDIVRSRIDKFEIPLHKCSDISRYFLDRVKKNYYVEGFDKGVAYLEKNYHNDSKFDYAVWGMTYIAEMICKHIEDNYPNAKLVAVFDKNRQSIFKGKRIGKIEESDEETLLDIEIFVTAVAATNVAIKYFNEIGKSDMFCLCYKG